MADEHTDSLGQIMEDPVWEKYGPGKDPRCDSCMMHSGFEAGSIIQAIKNPRDLIDLVSGLIKSGGNGNGNGNGRGSHQKEEEIAEVRIES